MNNRAFTMSFILAAFAVMMVHSYVESNLERQKEKFGQMVTVVVAKENIKELETLDQINLHIIEMPKKFVQPGAGRKLKDFEGGLAIAPIQKGEQITRTKVTVIGSRTGLSRQVTVGRRAITVRVDDVKGVNRLIKPGDRVDVISIIDLGKGDPFLVEAKTVLQDVLVLSTGKLITNTVPGILEADPYRRGKRAKKVSNLTEYTSYNSVTLEVDPIEMQQLFLIEQRLGGVYLALRNNDDNAKENLDTATVREILGKNSKLARGSARGQQDAARKRALASPGGARGRGFQPTNPRTR